MNLTRSVMKHRATVERDTGTARDPFNSRVPAFEQVHNDLACYVQARMERTVADNDKFVAIADWLMLAPMDADLKEEDVVTKVTNRRGKVLFENRLRITGLVSLETHQEAALEQYS